jgi:hypothetical protein
VGEPAAQLDVQLPGDRHVIGRGVTRLGHVHPDDARFQVHVPDRQPLEFGLAHRQVRAQRQDDPVLREVGDLDQPQQLGGAEPVAHQRLRPGRPDEQRRVLDQPALAHAERQERAQLVQPGDGGRLADVALDQLPPVRDQVVVERPELLDADLGAVVDERAQAGRFAVPGGAGVAAVPDAPQPVLAQRPMQAQWWCRHCGSRHDLRSPSLHAASERRPTATVA